MYVCINKNYEEYCWQLLCVSLVYFPNHIRFQNNTLYMFSTTLEKKFNLLLHHMKHGYIAQYPCINILGTNDW